MSPDSAAKLPLLTRIVAGGISPILFLAFLILYVFPHDTARLFAWPVKPPMTAMLMGAGYLAGTYYFLEVLRARRWNTVAPTLNGIGVFATSMLIATLLHWDKFTHGHAIFWLWFVIYVVTPPIVWWIVFANRRLDEGRPDEDGRVSPSIARWSLGLVFALLVLAGIVFFVAPPVAAAWWPWPTTPLSSRIIGGWLAMIGVGGISMARDPRWSSWPVTLRTGMIWFALLLLGALRSPESFRGPAAHAAFLATVGLLLAGFALVYRLGSARR